MELKRQGKERNNNSNKKARSLLSSQVESALEEENPEITLLGSGNSTMASWANFKLFGLVVQICHH